MQCGGVINISGSGGTNRLTNWTRTIHLNCNATSRSSYSSIVADGKDDDGMGCKMREWPQIQSTSSSCYSLLCVVAGAVSVKPNRNSTFFISS